MKARALSIRQPWAWHIVRPDLAGTARQHAVQHQITKSIENRTWATKLRGGILIHAAKGMTEADYWACDDFAATALAGKTMADGSPAGRATPMDAPRGGIVGYAEVIDCICTERHEAMPEGKRSPWFVGDFGFQLANVHPLPFLPLSGSLSFFHVEVPDDYIPAHLVERLAP